jgi:UDP-N-acetylglucosamine 2-epimerase (non-hydrolysing)
MVHGDTTTAMASSIAAFYSHIPVAHVEAGLRTSKKYSPFPEEINRRIISVVTDYHFAPTLKAKSNLLIEGIQENRIFVTGNTVIDALYIGVNKIKSEPELAKLLMKQFFFLESSRRMILVTGHRRENFGEGFDNICKALVNIANARQDIDIVYPVHLNPRVRDSVRRIIFESGCSNIYLVDPVGYIPFVYLMMRCFLVLTDSGGVQEEASSLKKPVLVMRDNTERQEGVDSGALKIVGTSVDNIVNETLSLLDDAAKYKVMHQAINPFGDGTAAKKIIQVISQNILNV